MEIEPPKPDPSPPQQEQPNPKRQKMSTTTTDDDDDGNTDNAPSIPRIPKYKRRKIAIFFAYCGVGYQGMQKNPGAKTIEGDFEEALLVTGAIPEEERGQHRRFDWARSARTDKGVSAVGQVVSGRFFVDPPGFIERLNSNLSPQIRVFGYKRATPSFNAKKFCDRRRYVYLIPVFALDPSCHRDRESVMASLGSGNELTKCFECSERGRKVFGVMGKVNYESKIEAEPSKIEAESIKIDAEPIEIEAEPIKIEAESIKIGSGDSSNTGSAIEKGVIAEKDITKNNDADNNNAVSETGMKLENGVVENEKTEEDIVVVENGNGSAELENKSEFCYGDEVKERFNRILKSYVGTHNFHNFTTRTKAEDPAAKRYILSFNANTVVKVDGIEFVKCEVVGQSFMLHQIRKMIGLAVAIMRNYAPESLIETAFQQKVRITVPMAPEVGLYLDECFFSSYNQKWKDSHEELSMKAYAEEAEDFKLKYIYSHIASTEHKDGVMGLWLHSLNYRNYPDLRAVDNVDKSSDLNGMESADNGPSSEVKDTDTVTVDNVDKSSDLNGMEYADNGPSSKVKDTDTVTVDNVDNSSDLNGVESVDNGPSPEVMNTDTVNVAK